MVYRILVPPAQVGFELIDAERCRRGEQHQPSVWRNANCKKARRREPRRNQCDQYMTVKQKAPDDASIA
jgi:hypothetical protein